MDAYQIAYLMENDIASYSESIKKTLQEGDEGDKLYAALYLLNENSISFNSAIAIIRKNCGCIETMKAWEMSAAYINNTSSKLFSDSNKLLKNPRNILITLFNLCPLYLRKRDSENACQAIMRFMDDNAGSREDMQLAMNVILNKFSK